MSVTLPSFSWSWLKSPKVWREKTSSWDINPEFVLPKKSSLKVPSWTLEILFVWTLSNDFWYENTGKVLVFKSSNCWSKISIPTE